MFHAGFSEVDGSLNVTHQLNLDNAGNFIVGSGANISAGSISAGGFIDLFNGTLSSAGDVTFNPNSILLAEVDASSPTIHAGHIHVGGTANLSGTLGLNLLNDSVMLPHQSIELMDWSSHVGTFDNFVFDSPYPGLSFQAIYKDDQLDITATAMDGDANLDGVVNLLDLNAIATNYGRTSQNWLGGDFSGDGMVNMADFNLLAAHFGQSLPQPASVPLGTLIPEPAILVPSIFYFLFARRRKVAR